MAKEMTETKVLARADELLSGLDEPARRRVITWIVAKWPLPAQEMGTILSVERER